MTQMDQSYLLTVSLIENIRIPIRTDLKNKA